VYEYYVGDKLCVGLTVEDPSPGFVKLIDNTPLKGRLQIVSECKPPVPAALPDGNAGSNSNGK
jgi:hypothetical protein